MQASFDLYSLALLKLLQNLFKLGERMKIFIPLLILVSLLAGLAGCSQIQMGDPKMSVGLASSKKTLIPPPSNDHSAESKARYVAPRAMDDFTKALTAQGRDWHKHGVYVETLDGAVPV